MDHILPGMGWKARLNDVAVSHPDQVVTRNCRRSICVSSTDARVSRCETAVLRRKSGESGNIDPKYSQGNTGSSTMLFCCFNSSEPDAQDAYERQTGDTLGGNYPGARRMIKTGGNALQAVPVPVPMNQSNKTIYEPWQPLNNRRQNVGSENNLLQGTLHSFWIGN